MISQFLLWLGFGFYRFFWMYDLTIVILMAINAGLFLILAFMLGLRNKIVFWFTVIFVAVNAFLSIADQAGIYDIITFILSSIILVLLIINRKQLSK